MTITAKNSALMYGTTSTSNSPDITDRKRMGGSSAITFLMKIGVKVLYKMSSKSIMKTIATQFRIRSLLVGDRAT
eukprot:CAMPEP_0194755208 /NCGR_PEP_ID=MMETSP0323_2-20130528/9101_1 /TAXON_ID=2866 ORGANISM="Crypthecodinium cohnii, Strain Seligo" /NCGR_SAMPLE_ID=MMETSP0323_2 /ASSEMBLY_ACC=CAM_ASM_000346 /LENGTH=74 /DNA_ID=CAMNT_0039674149 /DNA_START=117 /DNA_END=341 /DNA_ORIENTATION=-